MAKRMINFGDIDQFRTIIRNIEHSAQYVGFDEETQTNIMDRNAKMPIVKAIASEKIHGSNASVCFSNMDGFWVQSRSNIITIEKDNAACAFAAYGSQDHWMDIILKLAEWHNIDLDKNIISVFFEWAGGNIQKNSAVSGFDKMAFIFQHFKVSPIEQILDVNGKQINATWHETFVMKNDNRVWLDSTDNKIYNVMNFPHWEFDIDFNRTSTAQNEMVDLVLNTIEPNSPLGQKLGKENNIGEGIVVTFMFKDVRYVFKVKGESHSNSKVKTLKPVDTEKEQIKIDFANYATPSWRLEQAWQNTFGIENEKMEPIINEIGTFLRLVIADVWKEETDVAFEKNVEPKEINSLISKIAKTWFIEELDKYYGLK